MSSPRLTAAVALTTAVAFTSAGCASRTWPTTYAAAANPAFASRSLPVSTVDVLPIDVDVWTEPDRADEAPGVHRRGSVVAVAAIAAGLRAKGYRVGSRIDWHGLGVWPAAATAPVMTPEEVDATAGALASYGAAAARGPGLPVPYLPVRLGTATGSDATLYLGGWSYLGHSDDDDDAAIAALVIVGLVAAVAVTAAVASKSGGMSGGGGGRRVGGPSEPRSGAHWPRGGGGSRWGGRGGHGGGGGIGSLAGRAVGALGRATVATGRLALRAAATTGELALDVGVAAARATGHIAHATMRSAYIDVHGPHTHIEILGPAYTPCSDMAPGCPNQVSSWRAPPSQGESEMYLEMTLVDNRTGRVLWHVRQLFPAEGSSARDVKRAVDGLLSTLPPAP